MDERASVPLESIVSIAVNDNPKFKNCRFDIKAKRWAGQPYPREFEGDNITPTIKTYRLLAPSPADRHRWVKILTPMVERRQSAESDM